MLDAAAEGISFALIASEDIHLLKRVSMQEGKVCTCVTELDTLSCPKHS